MEYYGNNDYRDYLAHYGVKGMEWGKHKFLKKNVRSFRRGVAVYNDMPRAQFSLLNKTKKKLKKTLPQLEMPGKAKTNKAERASEETTDRAKDVLKVAKDIIRGKYGSGSKRREALTKKYGSWEEYQNKVNELLGSKKRHPVRATAAKAGKKKVDALMMRKSTGGKTGSNHKTSSSGSSRRSSVNKKSDNTKSSSRTPRASTRSSRRSSINKKTSSRSTLIRAKSRFNRYKSSSAIRTSTRAKSRYNRYKSSSRTKK